MSEATDKAVTVLTGLVEQAASGIDSAVAFSQAQIPDIIQQLLLWEFTRSIISFSSALILFPICLFLCLKINSYFDRWAIKANDDFNKGESWTRFISSGSATSMKYDLIVSGTGKVVCMAILWISLFFYSVSMINLTWLKIWLAPKLYLLEYAASLVK